MSKQKQRYRIRNWRAYNAALVERGSLTVWFEDSHRARWYETARSGRRGAPRRYSDIAVQCGLVIREVFHLPLRATEGLMQSLVTLLGADLAVPDHSTFSRRAAALTVQIKRCGSKQPRDIVIDSTGLKVHGAGEWHAHRYGKPRRTWRKLHLAVDANTHEVIAAELTMDTVGDPTVFPDLLEQLPPEEPIASVAADGTYDTWDCHQTLLEHQAEALIPPRSTAVAWPPQAHGQPHPRTAILEYRQQHGEEAWKIHSGYHRRSLAETAMFRFKTLFGERLSNRRFDTQTTQAYVRLAAMNIMTQLGMPDTVAVC